MLRTRQVFLAVLVVVIALTSRLVAVDPEIPDPTPGTETEVAAEEQPQLSYFVVLYRPGPAFEKDKNFLEQPYLQQRRGMGIFKVESLEQAKQLLQEDPLVRHKVVRTKIHPFTPTASGCID